LDSKDPVETLVLNSLVVGVSQDIGTDECCAVCFDVLLDPVTLPCGHTLDARCLMRVGNKVDEEVPVNRYIRTKFMSRVQMFY
jgi:hypothetical protein